MRVTLKDSETPPAPRKYPYIGVVKNNGRMVLFTAASTGLELRGATANNTWYDFSKSWDESCFELYNGTVELSNS